MNADCRLLIVEDDENVQTLVRTILRNHCSTIDIASDGDRALELLKSTPYDVVVLDIMLPKKNGFEVAEAIAAMAKPPGLIVLSAIARYFQNHFPPKTVVLQKPFDIEQLDEALRTVRADVS